MVLQGFTKSLVRSLHFINNNNKEEANMLSAEKNDKAYGSDSKLQSFVLIFSSGSKFTGCLPLHSIYLAPN